MEFSEFWELVETYFTKLETHHIAIIIGAITTIISNIIWIVYISKKLKNNKKANIEKEKIIIKKSWNIGTNILIFVFKLLDLFWPAKKFKQKIDKLRAIKKQVSNNL